MVLPRDPDTCYAYWEVSAASRNRLQKELGERGLGRARLVLRLLHADGSSTDRDVSGPIRAVYFHPGPDPMVRAELGFELEGGEYRPVVRAAPRARPRRGGAPSEKSWPVVEEVYARACRAAGESVGWKFASGEDLLGP